MNAKRLRQILPPAAAVLLFAAAARADHDAALNARQKAALENLDEVFAAFLEDEGGAAVGALKMRRALQEAVQGRLIDSLRDDLQNGDGPGLGNPDGDVVIVEFFDYQCGYCRRVFEPLMDVAAADGNIRIAVREFPILGEMSTVAARAGIAAHKQGKYAAFHAEMLSRPGGVDEAAIEASAIVAGMDLEQMRADMESPEVEAEIAKNREVASVLGVSGTPAFVIGDAFIPGAMSADTLRQLIANARGGGGH